LQSGQSFAIAGLLDNRTTESLSKIPGLADIPFFGKLFTTRSTSKTNSELLVIVTPELVEPIPEGQPLPELPRPQPFLEGPGILNQSPQTPASDRTGPGAVRPVRSEISVQELEQLQRVNPQDSGSAGQPPAAAAPILNPAAALTPVTGSGGVVGDPGIAAAGGATVRTR